jgi:flagellar basal-body rod modification protein FlgD
MTTPISSGYGASLAVTVPSDPAVASGDNTKLSSDAFLKLLVAQLQYQDPSKPVDTSAFMNETATLTQVQSMEANAQNSVDMLSAQRAQTAASLVGKTVNYLDGKGQTATGLVTAATISTPNPTLRIVATDVSLAQVQQVLAATT